MVLNLIRKHFGGTGKNLIVFGVDMGSTTKIGNIKKDILILGKGRTQGLEHTLSTKCKQSTLPKKIQNFFEFAL